MLPLAGETDRARYAALCEAIGFLYIDPPSEPSAATTTTGVGSDSSSRGGVLPTGQRITVHTLRRLFLLCGIKRHHCVRVVGRLLASLLAHWNGSGLLGCPSPAQQRQAEELAGTPVVVAVRRLWVDADGWKEATAGPPVTHHDLIRVASPHTRATETSSTTTTETVLPSSDRFVLCVAPHAAAEALMGRLLAAELQGAMATADPLPRWRMARRLLGSCSSSRTHHDGNDDRTSLVVLVGGTSGSGKSTLASLIAGQIGAAHVLSTDTVRQLLRADTTAEAAPWLFLSTYEAYKAAPIAAAARAEAGTTSSSSGGEKGNSPAPSPTPAEVVAAYERQAAAVLAALDAALDRLINRGPSVVVVVEGAHLLPRYMARKQRELWGHRVLCLPLLVQIRKEDRHRQRFAVRARCMSLNPKGNKYVSHLAHIRVIQTFLAVQAEEEKAAGARLLSINNTNIDRSLMVAHQALLRLMEHVDERGWTGAVATSVVNQGCCPTTEHGEGGTPPVVGASVSAKEMLEHLRQRRAARGGAGPQIPRLRQSPAAGGNEDGNGDEGSHFSCHLQQEHDPAAALPCREALALSPSPFSPGLSVCRPKPTAGGESGANSNHHDNSRGSGGNEGCTHAPAHSCEDDDEDEVGSLLEEPQWTQAHSLPSPSFF